MSKSRNSGLYSQDNIIGNFKRAARSSDRNSATAQCIRTGKKKLRSQPKEQIRFSGRFFQESIEANK